MEEEKSSSEPIKPAGISPKRYLLWGVLLLLILLITYWVWRPKKTEPNQVATPQPVFHRDEPAQEQILQNDYKKKIQEMLDSGMNVGEISHETGVRKDVIRKIKKEQKADAKK